MAEKMVLWSFKMTLWGYIPNKREATAFFFFFKSSTIGSAASSVFFKDQCCLRQRLPSNPR